VKKGRAGEALLFFEGTLYGNREYYLALPEVGIRAASAGILNTPAMCQVK
jgi:hypothetical protein